MGFDEITNILYLLLQGMGVGIAASITVGPVAVLCIQRTLSKSRRSGFASGLGVACADTLMAIFAMLFSSILQRSIEANRLILSVVSGIIVVIVGVYIFLQNPVTQIRRNRVGISPKHKPVSFIFVGPTGVGKTELVKQLADDLFNAPESLIRLDMSEFMEKHSVSRIVGSPPGYVGYDEAGQLTEKIRRKPYSVVLFDEIEKAHPDVLNVLLQILDDGQITDAHGRKVNFENTIIVMTSNAGSDTKSAGAVGFGGSADDQGKERTMKALRDFLRPEFLNRVDEIICFNHLSKENFAGIARIMLEELRKSLSDKGYTFHYDDALVDYLVEKSYSMTYGARNLRRLIQKELEDPMAARIIDSFENPITQISATAADGAVHLYTL